MYTHDLEQLTQLLTEDIQLVADGGGKVSAIRQPLIHQARVLRFFERLLCQAWSALSWEICPMNGSIGFRLYDSTGCVIVLTFGFSQDQRIHNIYVLRNPDKIRIS